MAPILFISVIAAELICGLGSLGTAQDAAQNGQTGLVSYVGADKCLMCHSKMKAQWGGNPHGKITESVTDPSLKGCEACHGPGSLHVEASGAKAHIKLPPSLNKLEFTSICMKCHGERGSVAPKEWKKLDASTWKRTKHYGKNITCDKCHTIHGAGGPEKMLVADAQNLCDICHKDVSEGGGYVHTPVREKKCLLCHDPHGVDQQPHSVRKNISDICGSCHKTDTDEIKQKHSGIAPAGSRCVNCHDPHSKTAERSLLRTTEHMPFQGRKCELCHKGASDTNPAALKKDVKDLCSGCHGQVFSNISEQKTKHFPATEKMCVNCHNPHVSSRKSLMRDDFKVVCTACHKGVEEQLTGLHEHPPVAAGNCLTCHNPHGSGNERLLNKEPDALCKGCHSKFTFSHPLVEQKKNPKLDPVIRCYTCHSIHGSDIQKILKMPETELCNQCHRREVSTPANPDAEE